jgi:HEAT repeat protein
MKNILIAAALITGSAVSLTGTSYGHGGTYRGPGDTVPAGGGGGTGGGPATPGTGGPTTPGPGGPTTPGPGTPGAPGGAPAAPTGPRTQGGGGDSGPDLSVWQFWWGFNKEPYLNLRAAVQAGGIVTGSDDFFVGAGEQGTAKDTMRPSQEVIRGKVVPALKRILKEERNNNILSGAMVALAKIGDDPKAEGGQSEMAVELIRFLGDSTQEVAETAALGLGILGSESPANIELLIGILNDDVAKANEAIAKIDASLPKLSGKVNFRNRAFAAYGLGLIGARAADEGNKKNIANALAKMADGPAKQVGNYDVSVACIVAMGLVPMQIDEAALATPIDAKNGFARPAELKNRFDQIAWLMSYYQDEKNTFLVRAHAPRAVGNLMQGVPANADGKNPVREAVATRFVTDMDKLSKAENEIKQSCILALGQIGDCDDEKIDVEIRRQLMEVKEELADQMARNFAAIAIAQIGGRPGTGTAPTFGLEGKKKDENIRLFLAEQLDKGKSVYRAWAGLSIGVLERALADAKQPTSSDMKLAVRSAFKDAKQPMEVGAFAVSLGIMQDQDAKELLREKLDNVSDDEARGYTAVALGLVNDRAAIDQIQAILAKSKYRPDLLKSAAIGLGLMGDKTTVQSLVKMLGEAQGLASQAAISSALGFIGDARSIDSLITLMQDKQKTDNARGFAAAALGIVADKEMLPWNTKISVNINYRANTPTLTSPSAGTGILDIL